MAKPMVNMVTIGRISNAPVVSSEDLDFSKRTVSLVTDFIHYSLRSEGYQRGQPSSMQCKNQSNISRKMMQMADKFENKYEDTCMSMLKNSTFESIAEEMFKDGIDWGRIVALFSFGRSLVRSLSGELNIKQYVVDEMVYFIDEYLKSWIMERGGWMQCIVHFSEEILQLVLPAYSRVVNILRIMWLLLSLLLNISPGIRTRLKHGVGTTVKVTKLILWLCGDVETNPGPGNSRSEILRKFRKSQQSSVLILLYEHFDSGSITKSLYKEKPNWWPNDTPFVNITNHKKDDESIACFGKSIELLKNYVSGLSQDWNNILKCYNDLLNKCGDNVHLNMCKDKLLEWIGSKKIQKALQTVDTKSFMDDLRLKLKILGDLINQGETIPDDIADKVLAVQQSIDRSNRKRKQDSATGDGFHPQKRQNVNSSDNIMHVSSHIMPTSDHLPKSASQEAADQSEASDIDTNFNSGQIICSKDCSIVAPSRENRQLVPINETLDNEESSITNSFTELPSKDSNGLFTESATSASLELPGDLLDTLLDENVDDDIINNFDVDFLELSDGDLCFDE